MSLEANASLDEIFDNLPAITLDGLCPKAGGLLVIAPHPDDETLGCGGLIAAAVAKHVPVRIVLLTDGNASHPNSKNFPRERLAALRRNESIAAAARLGLPAERLHFLALPDGGVPNSGPSFDAAVAVVRDLANGHGISAVFTTWDGDPHPDHKSAFAIARALQLSDALLWAYPIWAWNAVFDRQRLTRLDAVQFDVSEHVASKKAAIAEHVTQLTDLIDDDPHGFKLDPAFVARFERNREVFIRV